MKQKKIKRNTQYAHIARDPDQNGVSLLRIMLEIHHSGREPLILRNDGDSCMGGQIKLTTQIHILLV